MHDKDRYCLILAALLLVGCGDMNSPNRDSKPSPSVSKVSDSNEVNAKNSDSEPPRNSKPLDITFDDVKLDIKENMVFDESMLTDRVRELEGKYVRIRGFICAQATFQQRNIQQFILIKNTECKFGPDGQFHHVMTVHLQPKDAIDFTIRPITVEGILKLDPKTGPDGNTWSLYRLEG